MDTEINRNCHIVKKRNRKLLMRFENYIYARNVKREMFLNRQLNITVLFNVFMINIGICEISRVVEVQSFKFSQM